MFMFGDIAFRLQRTLYSLFWSMFGLINIESIAVRQPGKQCVCLFVMFSIAFISQFIVISRLDRNRVQGDISFSLLAMTMSSHTYIAARL